MGKSMERESRALSAHKPRWQLPSAGLLLLAAWASGAQGAPGGRLGALRLGEYQCELPGEPNGPVGLRQPAEDFSVRLNSTYRAGNAEGTYLLTGDTVAMTSGPKQGQRFHRLSPNFLRKMDAQGKDSALRCIRLAPNRG